MRADVTVGTQKSAGSVPILIACLIVALGWCVLFFNSTLEDAHITFRYARNMAEGNGFGVWNIGEPPVEGFSSFLWMMLLAGAMRFGISPFLMAKILGASSFLAIIVMFYIASRSKEAGQLRGEALAIAALPLALFVPLGWYAVSGMEATFFAALVTGLLLAPSMFRTRAVRVAASAAFSIAAVLTRPEGVLLAFLIGGFHWWRDHERNGRILSTVPLAATALTFLAITALRLSYFDAPLPNTFYAKAAGGWHHVIFGLKYLALFARAAAPVLLLGMVGLLWSIKQRTIASVSVALATLLLVYIAYVAKVGGDPDSAFPMWRHFVHIAPVWALLLALLTVSLPLPSWARIATIILAIVLSDAAIAQQYWHRAAVEPAGLIERDGLLHLEPIDPYFAWVQRISDSHTVSAAALAGKWGWYVSGNQIDVLGLNDRHIAHEGRFDPAGPVDSKTDMAYVLGKHPDLIDGYMSGVALRDGVCGTDITHSLRPAMMQGLIESPVFKSEYLFVTNAPYSALDRALFVRRDYLSRMATVPVAVVPVTDTILFSRKCLPPWRIASRPRSAPER
jgi:arabinofuranosyltransferase